MNIEIKFELNGKRVPFSKVKHLVQGVFIAKCGNYYRLRELTKEKWPNYVLGSGSDGKNMHLMICHDIKDGIILPENSSEDPDGFLSIEIYGLESKRLGLPTMSMTSFRYGLECVLCYYGKQTTVASVVAKGR